MLEYDALSSFLLSCFGEDGQRNNLHVAGNPRFVYGDHEILRSILNSGLQGQTTKISSRRLFLEYFNCSYKYSFRSTRSDSRHGSQSSHSAISRDKHTSASRESHKEPSREKFSYARPKADDGRPSSYRDRTTRSDERRPHVPSSGDRSRSRHDSRSHHDNNNRHDTRHDSRHDAPRHEPRHESRHDTARHSGSFSGNSRSHNFPSRLVVINYSHS